jgi:hypothetical protein
VEDDRAMLTSGGTWRRGDRDGRVMSSMGSSGMSSMGHGGKKLGSKMEAVEEGHGVAPFYWPGNGEPRGREGKQR